MRNFFTSCALLAIATCALVSCKPKTETPEGILSKDEMAKILTEFYLKEAKINNMQLAHDSTLVLFQYYKQQYVKENNLKDSVLDVSYQYYLARPKQLSEVYDRIIDSLALREQREGAVAQ
jgi:Domain of unknown function (DUF4296)